MVEAGSSNGSNTEETKITIINAYGHRNKGDSAIVLSMIDALKEEFGTVSISIESWHSEQDREFYDADVFSTLWKYGITAPHINISPLAVYEAIRKIPPLLQATYDIKNLIEHPYFLREEETKLLRRMKESDLIISCGGGFLHDSHGPAFLKHLYSLKIATLTETPVMIYAQSIGPFRNDIYRSLVASVLNDVDYITLRDYVSGTYLKQTSVDDSLWEVTADAAFLLEPRQPERDDLLESMDEKTFSVGLTVRDWKYPDSENPEEKRERYRREMAKFSDYLQSEQNGYLYFFSHTPSDVKEAKLIADRCQQRDQITILDADIPPRELKYLTGEVDLFVGTRMHSTIFSMAMNTPTISIPYLPKSMDLMKRIGLEELAIKIEEITSSYLQQAVESISDDADNSGKLPEEIEILKGKSRENAKIANSLVR